MSLRTSAALALFAALSVPSTTSAQCPGQGNLVLELLTPTSPGVTPGSTIVVRLSGPPLTHVCLACDFGPGPTVVPHVGTICLDMSPSMVEAVFFLPASGVIEFQIQVPTEALGVFLCCQALGFDVVVPTGIAISNGLCFSISDPCTSGGIASVGTMTRLANVTNYPVMITSAASGRAGGSGSPSVQFSFDPAHPPTFPIANASGTLFVENVARVGDDLVVTSLLRAGSEISHRSHPNRLPNEHSFTVTAGDRTNTVSGVHTSCSQPIAVGMQFGAFTITSLSFPR